MTWKDELKSEIIDNGFDLGYFTLQELYKSSLDNLQKKFPQNNTCKCTIRRTLQELRDEGYLKFIEKGKYHVISDENKDWLHFIKTYNKNKSQINMIKKIRNLIIFYKYLIINYYKNIDKDLKKAYWFYCCFVWVGILSIHVPWSRYSKYLRIRYLRQNKYYELDNLFIFKLYYKSLQRIG